MLWGQLVRAAVLKTSACPVVVFRSRSVLHTFILHTKKESPTARLHGKLLFAEK